MLKGTSNLHDSHALLRACQAELGLRVQVLYPGVHMDFPGVLRLVRTNPTLDVGRP